MDTVFTNTQITIYAQCRKSKKQIRRNIVDFFTLIGVDLEARSSYVYMDYYEAPRPAIIISSKPESAAPWEVASIDNEANILIKDYPASEEALEILKRSCPQDSVKGRQYVNLTVGKYVINILSDDRVQAIEDRFVKMLKELTVDKVVSPSVYVTVLLRPDFLGVLKGPYLNGPG